MVHDFFVLIKCLWLLYMVFCNFFFDMDRVNWKLIPIINQYYLLRHKDIKFTWIKLTPNKYTINYQSNSHLTSTLSITNQTHT